MKKAVLWICVICGILVFTGCGQKNLLSDFSARCGVDLTPGKVESVSDTHGGFHGDGYLLATVCFPDGSVYEKMKTSDRWRDLPLSENLESFVYQPFDDRVSIPPIENGGIIFMTDTMKVKIRMTIRVFWIGVPIILRWQFMMPTQTGCTGLHTTPDVQRVPARYGLLRNVRYGGSAVNASCKTGYGFFQNVCVSPIGFGDAFLQRPFYV